MPSSEHTTPPQEQQNAPASLGAKETQDDQRRPFVAPRLECHNELPVITAGSISTNAWGFEEDG